MTLRNPSFENGHRATAIGNVPSDWSIVYLDGETPPGFDRPAVAPEAQVPPKRDIPENEWPLFFLDGDHCLKVFKGQGAIWFALSQHVTGLEPGLLYRFVAPVHLDVYSWDDGKMWPDIGSYAAEARAGISGPHEGWGAVDWADWQAPEYGTLEYGAYREVVLEFVADDSGEARLWVMCKAKWSNLSNNFFFDKFELIQIGDPDPLPSDRGQPRIQYERTYVLLPQDADAAEWMAVTERHLQDGRTFGSSADDAGIGDLDIRRVICVRPEAWSKDGNPDDLRDFFREYYPEVEVEVEGQTLPFVLQGQRDARWRGLPFGEGCVTIGQSGCYITCLAMAQRFYDLDESATPLTVDQTLGVDGYSYDKDAGCKCLAEWEDIRAKLGLDISAHSEADDWLDAGKCAMAEVRLSGHQHFVLAIAKDNDRYLCLDPWYNVERWVDEVYPTIVSWRLLEPMDDPEPPPPPPPPQRATRGHFGPHIQSMGGSSLRAALLGYIGRVKPPVVKVFGAGDVFAIKEASPDTAVVFRRWLNAHDQEQLRDSPNKHRAAREYMALFSDVFDDIVPRLMVNYPDQSPVLYVESINEEYACNSANNVDTAAFDIAFIEEVAALGLPVRTSVFTAAQGTPEITGPDLDIALSVARVAEQHGALMGYHNYWGANIALPPGELLAAGWSWSPGRWELFDEYFVQHDVHVTWFGGESGACTSDNGWNLDPGGGWRASGCHDGDVWRLKTEIMLYEDKAVAWNAENDDRFLGSVGFTDGSDWDTFLYGGAWYAIGDAMMARYG